MIEQWSIPLTSCIFGSTDHDHGFVYNTLYLKYPPSDLLKSMYIKERHEAADMFL